MRFARGIAPVAAGWVLGIGLGCTIDLAHRIACGDGYVDPAAGEECDPQVPESYQRACKDSIYGGGTGACDPMTCTLVVNAVQCAFCGDNIINGPPNADSDTEDGGTDAGDELEECDNAVFGGAVCEGGGVLRCTDECTLDRSGCLPYCGDHDPGPGEECDPDPQDDFQALRSCAPTEDSGPSLDSPFGEFHVYGSGNVECVAETCRWDRSKCSYCGNGVLDGALLLDDATGTVSAAEFCDGDQFDSQRLTDKYGDACERQRPGTRRNVRCAEGCGDVEEIPGSSCCVKGGEICPAEGSGVECCYAFLHPEDESPCLEDPGGVFPDFCKS